MSRQDRSWVRYAVAYVRRNYPVMALDLVVLGSWMILGTELLNALGAPRWLQYVVLFLGVVAYAEVTPQWESVGD